MGGWGETGQWKGGRGVGVLSTLAIQVCVCVCVCVCRRLCECEGVCVSVCVVFSLRCIDQD